MHLTRLHYKNNWDRMRDSDSSFGASPSICSIAKETPVLVCGSNSSTAQTVGCTFSPGRHSNIAKKCQPSKKSSTRVNATASVDLGDSGDDDDGDGDPDGPSEFPPPPPTQYNQFSESYKPLSTNGLLRLPQVLELFPVSKSTWWAGVKAGRYPAPVKPSRRTTAWRHSDILKLIELLAARTTATAVQEVFQ